MDDLQMHSIYYPVAQVVVPYHFLCNGRTVVNETKLAVYLHPELHLPGTLGG